ncbi:Ig-like domain-containing protein [Bdellovibrio sp.]|uniref:Ig-like domain-containing protein n=1 Tax=Bdellovibrio sp. TaxID=28201 RepID=UPI0039E4B2CD
MAERTSKTLIIAISFTAYVLLGTGCSFSASILESLSKQNDKVVLSPEEIAPINNSNQGSFPISGECPVGATSITLGTPLDLTLNCQDGHFSETLDLTSFPEGTTSVIVTPNTGFPTQWEFNKDTVAPTFNVSSYPIYINLENQNAFIISGTCSEQDQYIQIQIQSIQSQARCDQGTFSSNVNLSSLAEGSFSGNLSLQDAAGNTVTYNIPLITKDITPPGAVTVSDLPGNPSPLYLLELTVQSSGATEYQYLIGPSSSTDCTQKASYKPKQNISMPISENISALADGSYKICVWTLDVAGNYQNSQDVFSYTWVKDSTLALGILSAYSPAGSPSKNTADRTLTVSGVNIVSYKAVNVKDIACSSADFSSAAEIPVATPWILEVQSGDGVYRACVLGKNSLGNWQPASSPSSSASLTIDTTAPTLTLSSTATDPTPLSSFTVTASFSEDVTGFSLSDLTPTNGTLSALTGGPRNYNFIFTPSGDGPTSVSFGSSSVQDLAGNTNTTTSSFSRVYDGTAPTVSLSSSAPLNTPTSPISFTVTFSEPVSGFATTDLTVSNGTVTQFSGGPAVYAVEVTPLLQGAVSLDVGANKAHDSAGNGNTMAAASVSRTFDSVAPSVTLSSTSPTYVTGPFTVQAVFNENITNFAASDITLINASVSAFSGGPTHYSFTVTPQGQGQVEISIPSSVAQDGAGNDNNASSVLIRQSDSVAPSVSLSTTSSNPTNSGFSVTATFSESVSGFVASDVGVVNGVLSNFSGGPSIYNFDITPSTDGTVTISVNAGVAKDGAGLDNIAATNLVITYDSTMPSVTLTSADPDPAAGPFSVTATFSEDVVNFDASDILTPKATISNFSGGPQVYTFDVTPLGDGVISVVIPPGATTDLTGSPNLLGSISRTVDTSAPTTIIASPTLETTTLDPIPFGVVFSEDVVNFAESKLQVTNGTITNFSGTGSSYRFEVTPTATGLVAVSVAAGAAADPLGNPSSAASLTRNYNPLSLTATLASSTTQIFSSGTMQVTVNFNQNSTLTAGDLKITNATLSQITGTGSNYTVEVTPTAQGLVEVQLLSVEDHPRISRLYDSQPPTAPTGVAVDDTNATLFETPHITWSGDADDGAEGSGVDHYEAAIYSRFDELAKNATTITKGQSFSINLRSQEDYYAVVRAVDKAGNVSAWSTPTDLWTINRRIIVAGGRRFCFIQINGQLKCWGDNTIGELGLGDTNNRGDAAGEMDALPDINLGTGRSVKKVALHASATCAILDNDELKCWGMRSLGIGVASNVVIGDALSEMGNALPAVNLGVGRKPIQLVMGYSACALLDDGSVKCWGDNSKGQLGIGSTSYQAEPQPHLGFGSDFIVRKMVSSDSPATVCALSTSGTVKCWGEGTYGALGSGNTTSLGTSSAQMGTNLPYLQFGTSRTVKDLFASDGSFCAVLNNDTLKCWGRNNGGVLGVGDTSDRGDNANEMGDNLQPALLGTGAIPYISIPNSTAQTNCVMMADGKAKCFGFMGTNLGYGNNTQRYLTANLGDNLPFLDFGSSRKAVDLVGVGTATCATLEDKTYICWGASLKGQLGQGNTATIGDNEAITTYVAPAFFYNLKMIVTPQNEKVTINTTKIFQGSGGFAPYTYALISGIGSINATTGEYSAPGTTGTATIQATDSKGNTATTTVYVTDCIAGSMTYTYTGTMQTFTMPAGCTKATIKAWGGGGAGSSQFNSYGSYGGGGGFAQGTLNVTSGEQLYVFVGGSGVVNGAGGYNGGAGAGPTMSDPYNGTNPKAGSGGGASDVRRGGMTLSDRILVAGGGGGAGSCYLMYNNTCTGGAGGGFSGVNGSMHNGTVYINLGFISGPGTISGYGGRGGTASAGGAGGVCTACSGNSGSAGSFGQGGAPYSGVSVIPGGGGGGGYYGGGGGAGWSGGGGGSSYVGGLTNSTTSAGSGSSAGNSADVDANGAGSGGTLNMQGTAGRVVISYE